MPSRLALADGADRLEGADAALASYLASKRGWVALMALLHLCQPL